MLSLLEIPRKASDDPANMYTEGNSLTLSTMKVLEPRVAQQLSLLVPGQFPELSHELLERCLVSHHLA